jgi:MYXO-CTERM domain-containing protein
LLTLDNAGNTLTGVQATKGNITVRNVDLLDLKKLEIAANKTITAANVVVNELAKLEAGATLAGNLELANSATIELGGEVTLNGMLNLQTELTLSGAVLDAVQGLAEGKSYTLFTGVTGLNLQQTVTLYNMRSLAEQTNDAVSYSELMDGGQVAAAEYFSNLKGNPGLVLSYDATNHTVSITNTQAVPEPTAATLSLLALAGLCARRRRK